MPGCQQNLIERKASIPLQSSVLSYCSDICSLLSYKVGRINHRPAGTNLVKKQMRKGLKYRQQNSIQNFNLNLANKSLENVDKKDNWKQ
jgi:hypothetical protein